MAGSPLTGLRLHTAVGLSGAAGLVWQVLWVRQLGWVTGATTEAVAIGTAIFLAGLGVGAWLGGHAADMGRPLRLLARLEVVVALMGVGLATLLPHLGALPDLSWTSTNGWNVASPATVLAQVSTALLLLGLPCIAMGATLPLAARAVVGPRIDRAGWRIGALYASNTLGAAAGALAADLLLVPSFGVWGAQVAAAGTNLAAAAVIVWTPMRREPRGWQSPPTGRPGRAAFVLGILGFAGLGIEIVHVRFLGSALGPYRAVFSMVLAVHLLGLQGGALIGGLWTRLGGRPETGLAWAIVTFVTATLTSILHFDPESLLRAQLASAPSVRTYGPLLPLLGVDLFAVGRVVFAPALALGTLFPLGNALAQDDAATIGRRTGGLALANTLGNAMGALTTGFVLLPLCGLQGTLAVLTGMACLASLVLPSARLTGIAATVLVLGWLTAIPAGTVLWKSFPANRAQHEGVLNVREGVHGTVVVTGQPGGPARLWTDGHPMTSTTVHAQRYMRVLAHAPLLLQSNPQRAVIIGFGVGNTTHAASLHGLTLHVVDRSPDVLHQAPWFAHANHGVLEHPSVEVYVDDGRHHLHTLAPSSIDMIALEPPPIGHAGVASLYSTDLYELARSRLTDTGAIAQWLPAYQLPAPAVSSLVRAFVDVFPDAVLLLPSGREMVLLGHLKPTPFDLATIERRLAARPAVAADLAPYGLDDPGEWVVMFGADGAHLDAVTAGSPPVTDDQPQLEHHAASHVMETSLPSRLLDPRRWRTWCPTCPTGRLDSALAVTTRIVTSPSYMRFSNLVDPQSTASVPLIGPTVEERRAIESSPSLQALNGSP